MKILMINAVTGEARCPVLMSYLLDSIDLKDGKYILSLRDCVSLPDTAKVQDLVKRFSLGKAKATVDFSAAVSAVDVSIESPVVQDFIDLYDAVCEHLGMEHAHLPRPRRRLDDLSFIRGLRNDLAALRRYFASLLRFNRKAAN